MLFDEQVWKTYCITTQNVEEYGTNFYKYKGGFEYNINFPVTHEVYEENAYGEGEHSYYECPGVTEATACALVMQHVNRYNGLQGSFDYITSCEVVDSPFDTFDHPVFNGTIDELIEEIESEKVTIGA
tara:strand:+ start:5569 stop:5952 length:384 start_codon:yes stop_codon:yes gene_type:complete